ncbi:EamA/RhaT family transporter [Aquimarina rhabdastrellae]
MIYLILSVLFSSILFIIFKFFDIYKIDTLQAIVINYVIATICGILNFEGTFVYTQLPSFDWFWGAAFLGFLFITIFNLIALTTQRNGVAVAAVASKMSLAIPILFGILIYGESTSIQKLIGITIALVAVYLTSATTHQTQTTYKRNLILPLFVFLGSGIIDTSLKYLETNYVPSNETALFSATIFCFAAILGIGTLLFKIIQGKVSFKTKNILGGIALGIPNYFSIYFLIKALRHHPDSAITFTINNIAILLLSTFFGILLFKEKLITKNWIGIALAVISIILVASVS